MAISMITQCHACSTHFRVTPEQLQAHQGQVRCGKCMTVFDGLKVIAELAELPLPAAAAGGGEAAAFKPRFAHC